MSFRMISVLAFVFACCLGVTALTVIFEPEPAQSYTIVSPGASTYQGKTAEWWAKRAVQARKDANARRNTIRELRRSLRHNPTIDEAVRLAHITYPNFTEARAWQIIEHESCRHCKNLGYIPSARTHAKNPRSTATGIVQFLIETYLSTPYGRAGASIYSPYASLLAAGWMHEHGRGREWAIGTGISGG